MKSSRILAALIALLAIAVVENALPTGFAWHAGTGLDVSRDSAGGEHFSSFELRLPNNDTVGLSFSTGGSWRDGGPGSTQEGQPGNNPA
jgi:hypothetical protein